MADRGENRIRLTSRLAAAAVAGLAFATPALAQSTTAIPEPTDLALFGLGVLGLIIGRRGARRRKSRD
ncbi:MAG TPA: PEP-CTERM sorting domain-containing protein [Novosphingobium sp.]|nr:PEP-CTERM sorting domain-containing protein [Novosphingobium sp.]